MHTNSMAANSNARQRQLMQLDQNCKALLSDQDIQYLSYALKEYRNFKSPEKLVRSLTVCLNTPAKLQIVKYVRNFVLPTQIQAFDTLIRNAFQKEALLRTGTNQTNGSIRPVASEGKYRIVALTRDKAGMGFNICGGKESGIGIYVSNIMRNSPAWNGGLMPYDQLVEVNGISLQEISLQSAAKLIAPLNKLKLVVKEGKTLRDSLSNLPEVNPWSLHTVEQSSPMNGSMKVNPLLEFVPDEPRVSSLQSSLNEVPRSLKSNSVTEEGSLQNFADGDAEKRVIHLSFDKNLDDFIGFNIRGGSEYGLGIYVSSVDRGSVAEVCGIRVGDQILEVNGRPFEDILHKEAVDIFKSHGDVYITVKAVGRIPAEKCFIEEYSWLAPDGSILGGQSNLEYLSSSMPSPLLRDGSKGVRDFADGAAQLPMNETINLPIEALRMSSTADVGTDPISPAAKENEEKKEQYGIGNDTTIGIAVDSEQADEEDAKLRRSPSSTSLISKKSSDSGKSERGNKSSLNSGEYSDSDRSRGEVSGHFSVKKGKRSKSFLQKQGDKLKAKFTLRSKKKEAKHNIFDSELYQKSGQTIDWLHYIEEKAKGLLYVNDYSALMKQIKDYLEKGDIELFSSNVLELLDTPAKSLVLDIRAIIFPHDLGRFDARVAKRELDNLVTHGEDVAKSPILDGQLSEVPPKRTLVTAVQDKGGKFRLKSQTEAEEFQKAKEEHSKKISKKYAKQRSILERDITIERYKSLSRMPHPSKEHTEAWNFEVDNQLEKDLDFIPTRDQPANLDDLYAKVDKSGTRGSLSAVFPPMKSEEVKENRAETRHTLERTMSDIMEARDTVVPDISRSNVRDEKDIAADIDSDDYTELDAVFPNKNISQNIQVDVEKQGKTLGISISGGRGSTQQPEIRIEKVFPGGAIADVGILKAGYRLISVDGNLLEDATHNEAVDMIRRSFTDKTKPYMSIVASVS